MVKSVGVEVTKWPWTSHLPFSVCFAISIKWGWHLFFSRKWRLSWKAWGDLTGTTTTPKGLSQADPPTQVWSVHELQDSCIKSVTYDPAITEDLEDSRRSRQEKSSMTSFQFNMAGYSLEPLSALEIAMQWLLTEKSPSWRGNFTHSPII